MGRSRKVLEMIEGEYKQWFKGEQTLPGTFGAKDPYPKIVRVGLDRYRQGGDKDLNWVWFHAASPVDKKEFEKYLVDTKDPLAMEPGSSEWRYKKFIYKIVKNIEKIQGGTYK
jgi:hypothetical protein